MRILPLIILLLRIREGRADHFEPHVDQLNFVINRMSLAVFFSLRLNYQSPERLLITIFAAGKHASLSVLIARTKCLVQG